MNGEGEPLTLNDLVDELQCIVDHIRAGVPPVPTSKELLEALDDLVKAGQKATPTKED